MLFSLHDLIAAVEFQTLICMFDAYQFGNILAVTLKLDILGIISHLLWYELACSAKVSELEQERDSDGIYKYARNEGNPVSYFPKGSSH